MSVSTMLAARLHGPRDMRIDSIPCPETPGVGEALLRVTAVGVCGSDLHTYRHARIGDTRLGGPLILGHEFGAVVEEVGGEAVDGNFAPLRPGTRVAVDPAMPCGRCALCERGHPNLCERIVFLGLYPDDGALCQWIRMPASTCFPVSDAIPDHLIPLLEPLGVAIHTVDLAKVRVGDRVAVLGCGPIGLLIIHLLRIAGVDTIHAVDRLENRLELAKRLGADHVYHADTGDAVQAVAEATGGRGVDIAVEAAHGGPAVQTCAEVLAHGGRLVVVGIDDQDQLAMRHSTARRKGLTIVMVRRMKHTYPRAIRLAETGRVDLEALVSHRLPLEAAADAYDLNADYRDNVIKAIVEP